MVRRRVEEGGERYWRVGDFADMPASAVSQALSRMTRERDIQRAGKGLYYKSRQTALGPSKPSLSDVSGRTVMPRVRPAGLTAANLLGFTTQNSPRGEYATASNGISRGAFGGEQAKVYTRRPESWARLDETEAALLDFLRSRGTLSELSPEKTVSHLLSLLMEPGRFSRLAAAAATEPPRVRAILGAAGQQIGADPLLLEELRGRLNPLSRFDFGALRTLRRAKEWQAR
ncbi:MAG: hypothetical protein KGL39_43685 [Patescibacteria group bacterium]|nr:hypothetical protein [Patescibacteria group bacterium]